MTKHVATLSSGIELRRWEMAVIAAEIVLAAGVVMGLIGAWGPRFVPGGSSVPAAIWLALGFFVLFWMVVPALNAYSRWRRGRGLPLLWTLVGSVAGSVVGGLVFALLA